MLTHCKNNGIHCKIIILCIALMLIHCKNNGIHCKINMICIALMLIHCKTNGIHSKINIICITLLLIPCKNNDMPLDRAVPADLPKYAPNGPWAPKCPHNPRTTPAQPPY